MDKNDIERRLEAAEKQNLGLLDEIKNLKAQLAEMQDEPEIPDFPEFKVGDDYYPHIRWESTPRKCTVDCLREEICKKPLTAEMNYFHFHSAEYYHFFESKCKLIAMMLHCKWYCDRNAKIDFYDSKTKWYLYKHHYANGNFGGWKVCTTTYNETATIYFSTEEAAQKCAEWLNTHWKEDGNDI